MQARHVSYERRALVLRNQLQFRELPLERTLAQVNEEREQKRKSGRDRTDGGDQSHDIHGSDGLAAIPTTPVNNEAGD